MEGLVDRLRLLLVVVFAGGLVVLGIWLSLEVLMGKKTFGEALRIQAGAVVGAAFVIWASFDFTGPMVIVSTLGKYFEELLRGSTSFITTTGLM